MAKVFQSLLLTGSSFRLLVFGTNLIAFRCQCSLAHSATAFARSPSTFWSMARHPLRHRRLFAVATARPVSLRCCHLRRRRYRRWRACLPAPASLEGKLACQRLLAVVAACLPSQPSPPLRLARHSGLLVAGKPAPCCRQAVSPPPSPLAMYHEA